MQRAKKGKLELAPLVPVLDGVGDTDRAAQLSVRFGHLHPATGFGDSIQLLGRNVPLIRLRTHQPYCLQSRVEQGLTLRPPVKKRICTKSNEPSS